MPRLNVKPLVKRSNATTRYEPRWINGAWTVFDRVNFGHGNPLGTRKEAQRIADSLNTGELKWTA